MLLPATFPLTTYADSPTLEQIYVTSTLGDQFGVADTASEGVVSSAQLQRQALLRPGEVLEAVPGVIVTQHSGDGKANQYFLRGFNLDHGTDFATSVNGIPVNMPTHAHGQGYSDLSFLIPELVSDIHFRKGTYSAEDGDFSAAGSARIEYYRSLPKDFAEVSVGGNGYRRSLVAGTNTKGNGTWLYGMEWYENNGPWQVAENYGKLNAVLRYSQGSERDGVTLTGMLYRGQWSGTDQIAARAGAQGADRFSSLDQSSGGMSDRYSLGGEWSTTTNNTRTQAKLYALRYDLNLFSNFTYCSKDFSATGTCNQGDQFEQADHRYVYGGEASKTWAHKLANMDSDTILGTVFRQDRIGAVGLYATQQRQRISTVREDQVTQSCVGVYLQNRLQWNERWRSVIGWRQDFYRARVNSDLAANSGKTSDNIGGPKLGLIYAPQNNLEFYANYGTGFHSNDARGATISVDPATGAAAQRVKVLVKAHGSELGMRIAPSPAMQLTATMWQLKLDSELLFVGDAGTTEPSRPSQRQGVEFSAHYHPLRWLAFDGNLALSRARFTDGGSAGNYIPGAMERILSGGMTVESLGPWFGNLRLRYFGPRSLTEDNSVRSSTSVLTNLRLGYHASPKTQITVDVLNLFDRKVNEIEYYYCSMLRSEVGSGGTCSDGSAGTDDIHFHPSEPRTMRVAIRTNF